MGWQNEVNNNYVVWCVNGSETVKEVNIAVKKDTLTWNGKRVKRELLLSQSRMGRNYSSNAVGEATYSIYI